MRPSWFRIGFTLTEILVVVVIIAILAVLSLPMLVKTIEKAKVGEAISNLNLIRTGQKIYFLEITQFSTDIGNLNIEDPNGPTNRYFQYSMPSGTTSNFIARATRRSDAPSPYNTYYYEIDKDGTISSYPPSNPF